MFLNAGAVHDLPIAEAAPVFVQLLSNSYWTSLKGRTGRVFVMGGGRAACQYDITGFGFAGLQHNVSVKFTNEDLARILKDRLFKPSQLKDRQEMLAVVGMVFPEEKFVPSVKINDQTLNLSIKYLRGDQFTEDEREILLRELTDLLPVSLEIQGSAKIRGSGVFACTEEGTSPYEGFGQSWKGRIDYQSSEFIYSFKIVYKGSIEINSGPLKSSINNAILRTAYRLSMLELDQLRFYSLETDKFDPIHLSLSQNNQQRN